MMLLDGGIDWKSEMFKRLDAMSEKLGVVAGHLWQVLVRQAVAEGIASLILAAIFIALLVAAIKLQQYCWKNGPPTSKNDILGDWDARFIVLSIISWITTVVSIICAAANLYSGILALINPEYVALQKILETIK